MRIQSYAHMLSMITLVSLVWIQDCFSEKCAQEKIALHRGFKYPEYSNTYAAVQLFSMSDIGRTTYNVKKPISMVLSRPGEFEPECELNSSSMLKIKASGVSIDFNGFEIKKVTKNRQGDYLSYATGIEVGFSPAELAADPTLEQVQNVVIKNGGLSNFEMGIVVHAGVKNIIIEDFYISRSPLGIMLLGQDDNKLSSCMLKKVRITGEFHDDALILQWAKVKVEDINVASIDGANGGTGIVQGKGGSPALGYGYGSSYCFMQLNHNPVTNADDAYTYYGMFVKNCVNVMLDNVLVKCMGYQGDRHEVVAPGATVGTVTNPATSSVSINGDVVLSEVTATVTKGLAVIDSSTVFLKCCEAVNLVSALTTYGIFVQRTSSMSVQNSAFSTNDAHHITTGTAQPVTDADVKVDTTVVDPKTGATIHSLYTAFCVDIASLPVSIPPLIDITIEPFRDTILDHKTAIDTGVSLSAMMFHVEQIIANAQGIISAYNTLVLAGSTPTPDDSDAHLQASALLQSGSNLFNHLFKSTYRSGRSCYGMFIQNAAVIEIEEVVANYNRAEHFVVGCNGVDSDVLYAKSLSCNHNVSDNVGDDTATPVAQAADSHAYGIRLFNTDTVTMHDVSSNFNSSFGLARGIYGFDVDSCKACGISCTNNEAVHATLQQGWVAGICLYHAKSGTFSSLNANANHAKRLSNGICFSCVVSSDIDCAHADNNLSDMSNVVGAYFDRCHSLGLQDISATSNIGSLQAYGMLYESCSAVNVDGAIADDNSVDRTNPLATASYGLWWNSPEACFLKNISGSNNRGRTLGVGLYAKQTRTFHVDQADFCLNSATEYVDGETTRCNDALNASKFFSNDYPSGALGMYFSESCDVSLKAVTACKNFAHRAAGIFALNSSDFVLCDCITSFQAATGNYFIDDPFKLDDLDPLNDILFCDFPIPFTQYSTLFGSPELEDPLNPGTIIPADQLNLLQAICCFLQSVALIPTLPNAGLAIKNHSMCSSTNGAISDCDSDPCNPDANNSEKKFVSSWLLIQAAMAKYRLFGGAVGLHIHDGDGFAVKNHFSNGNNSVKDNAAGIACTGSNKNHIFEGGRSINNDGWTESAFGAVVSGRYELGAVKPFYDALYATTTGTLTNDFDIGPGTQLLPRLDRFCTDIIDKKVLKYFKISLDCSCPGGSGTAEDFWLTNPVGGMGVGVLLADCAEHIEVRNMDCANNKGFSGFAFGLLQDVSANNNLDGNRFYQNFTNILGICFGLADITTHSTTIAMRNFMFCNRLGDYLNFNYLVPYNPADTFGQNFPIKTAFNGDFSTLVLAGAYDNIEIRFTKLAPQNPCVPDYIGSRDPTMPDMPSCWEDSGFLDTSGTTITAAFQQCIDDLSAIAPATGGLLTTFVNEIITAVLGAAPGPAAITAGRNAGVTAGLLEVVAIPAATVADLNRMMSMTALQELVCQEIFTILNNDPILLMTQEALSVLVPRKRSHIAGLNHFEARVAALQVGLRKGLLPIQAEAVSTVVSAVLEHCPDSGADAAVYAGRDMFALVSALDQTTRELTNNDLIAAQQALGNQSVTPDSNAQVQDAIERHVAIRLKRGQSEVDAVAKVIDPTRNYAVIVSDFITNNSSATQSALDLGISILDTFFDYGYEWTLSGTPRQNITESAVVYAATQSMTLLDAGKITEQTGFLTGALFSLLGQSELFKKPLQTAAQVQAHSMASLLSGHTTLFNALLDVLSQTLFINQQKEISSLVGGVVTVYEMLLKSISQEEAIVDGIRAAQDLTQLSTVNMDPCNILAHTIQTQIDVGARMMMLAGLGSYTPRETSACMFDVLKNSPTDLLAVTRAWSSKVPHMYAISYNSSLEYVDVTFDKDDINILVAGAVNAGAGADPGLLVYNKECLLLHKMNFSADVQSVTKHPVQDWIVVGLSDGSVQLIDSSGITPEGWTVNAAAVLPAHTDEVELVRFSPDGTRLVSAGRDNILRVIDTSNSNPALWAPLCAGAVGFDFTSIATGHITSVSFKDNNTVAVAHSGASEYRVLDITACSSVAHSITTDHKVLSVSYNHDGTQLAVGTDNSGTGTDAVVEIFDVSFVDPGSWVSLREFVVTGSTSFEAMKYHPTTNYLAVADSAGSSGWLLFDTTDSDPINWPVPVVKSSALTAGFVGICWNSLGTKLSLTTQDSDISFFDSSRIDTTQWSETKRTSKHTGKVHTAVFNHDATLLATASNDSTIEIWDGQNSRQSQMASVVAHTDVITALRFSADGAYLFSGSHDNLLRVWSMSTATPVAVQQIDLGADITSLSPVILVSSHYYVVAGLSDNSAKVIEFSLPSTLTVVDTITGHTGAINAVALQSNGARIVTASADGEAKCWDSSSTIPGGSAAMLECTLNDVVLGGAVNWHAGAVTTIDIGADGTKVFSGGADGTVFITDITTTATPVHVASIADATDEISSIQLHSNSSMLATTSRDGLVRVYDVSTLISPTLTKALLFPLNELCSVDWSTTGYDLLVAGDYGFGVQRAMNRFCVAIAQQVQDEISCTDRALRKAKEIMTLAGISETEAGVVAQAAVDYLTANPADVSGASRVVCNAFTTPLTNSELCNATVASIRNLDHPVDQAVSIVGLQGVNSLLATNTANEMYRYLRQNQGDVSGAAQLCVINNKLCRAVAQILNGYSTAEAEYVIELGFSNAIATAVAAAGASYLTSNPGDVTGAAQAVCDEFIVQGADIFGAFCTVLIPHMQNYFGFARQIVDLACLQQVGLLPSGGTGFFDEGYRLITVIFDALQSDPVSTANQTVAQTLCLGSTVVPCTPTPSASSITTAVQGRMAALDVALAPPIQLTKDFRRTLESCTISDVTIANPADPVETSAIASALVGRMQGQKVKSVTLDLLDLSVAADMADKLLNGGLLPCGSLKNLRGDALDGNGPGGGWGSSPSVLTGPFATLADYLNALGAYVLTTLIPSVAEYNALTSDEKDTIARAVVIRTLLCGNEETTLQLFDGTTDPSYPAQIASLVNKIVTTGLTPSIGLASLTLAARQEIAVAALLFYDTFSPFATSSELQAIVTAGFAGASAAGALGDTSKEPFFAFFGALGTVAGFMQDRTLNPLAANQQSLFDFIQVGSELARGFIGDHMVVTDIGASGYDGYAKDLSEPALAALAGGIMAEGLSVVMDGQSAFYGQFAVPLAYNQIFGDQLCKAIAKVVRDNGNTVSLGAAIGQFAGLTAPQATAVATAAVAPADLASARLAVCQEFSSQTTALPTPTQFCSAMVHHIVDLIQNPVTFSLNTTTLSLFGTAGRGHPAFVATDLMIAAAVSSALATQVGADLYTHLKDFPTDTAGAITICQEALR